MTAVERVVVEGVASVLAAAGVGVFLAPQSGAVYGSGDTAIVFGQIPPSPDRAIGITIYGARDEVVDNRTEFRVQLWMRGTPNDALDVGDLASAAFDALHGLVTVEFGVVHVIQVARLSTVPIGVDAAKRYERADNYAVLVNMPATPGRPGL